jgi:uncharacterized protein (TIGR03067 family)
MGIRLLMALASVILLVGLAPLPPKKTDKEADSKKALKELEGDWAIDRYELPSRAADIKHVATGIQIKNGTWSQYTDGDETRIVTASYKLKIDTSKKPPTIDMEYSASRKLSRVGIFQLDGDKLIIVYSLGGGTARPSSIKERGTNQYRLTLSRIGKKK